MPKLSPTSWKNLVKKLKEIGSLHDSVGEKGVVGAIHELPVLLSRNDL